MSSVKVTRKAESRIESGHPWIFSSDVAERGQSQPGDVVRVLNARGQCLGVAHYSSTSQIVLRMLSRKDQPVDRAFYLGRLQAALKHRQHVVRESDSYRLVHAEGDLLPGLIVDRYGDYLSVQLLDQGMDAASEVLTSCLEEVVQPKGILARNDVPVRKLESLPLVPKVLSGELPERVPVRMNGLALQADLLHGQKTGVYLDQRENYVAASHWARGRALDCFTSTGGFALHMAPSCESVEGIDSSAEALKTATANRDANGIKNVTFREANAFDYLAGLAAARRHFDTVVLDPPAFAKSKTNMDAALRGYKEINFKALKLLQPGGVLVTCSCSHHVNEGTLLQLVAEAALDAGKTLRVLERRAQAQDHPILLTVPETLYLKCLIFEVL
ncbi:class I SAM-dependent rRNA methyltransferase [uncultured Paludibaculum sp.]|uniref:class I SAM-dependent rRNA methyltransferase n=1 Tax=uncultured Paludibaculum sp. TaxID=1765020 RepID=UPI002AAA8AAF|nr:class I SAM-dependent rRNA methyltransferase [uncultured Paludibaculum sp.]